MRRLMLPIIVYVSLCSAQSYSVVFFGIAPGGAPSFETQMTQRIRERFIGVENVRLIDDRMSRQLQDRLDFQFPASVPRPLVESLIRMTGDTLLLVWGRFDDFEVSPQRRYLLGAEAVGRLKVTLILYSVQFRDYACIITMDVEARVHKPPVFFRPVASVTHITASDRITIANDIITQVGERSAAIVSAVVRHYMARIPPREPAVVKQEKMPSLENLFEIPSVDGRPLESEPLLPLESEPALPVESEPALPVESEPALPPAQPVPETLQEPASP